MGDVFHFVFRIVVIVSVRILNIAVCVKIVYMIRDINDLNIGFRIFLGCGFIICICMMQRDVRIFSRTADFRCHNCLNDVLCDVRINSLDGGANLTDPIEVRSHFRDFIKLDFREVDCRSVILLHAAFNDFPLAVVIQLFHHEGKLFSGGRRFIDVFYCFRISAFSVIFLILCCLLNDLIHKLGSLEARGGTGQAAAFVSP